MQVEDSEILLSGSRDMQSRYIKRDNPHEADKHIVFFENISMLWGYIKVWVRNLNLLL